jgi:hypothetical protein
MEIGRLPLGQSLADKHRAAELKWRGMPPGIPPAMAVEFMAKLIAGSTVRRLTGGGEYGPPLVSYERFKKHCKLQPEWGAEAWRVSKINESFRKGEPGRNLTHCKQGHPLSGANFYLYNNGKFRKCRACMKESESARRRMSEEQARKVVDSLQRGETIATITTGGSPTYIVNHRALLIFRQKNPKFERLVLRLSSANAKVHHAEASARRAQILRAPTIAEHGADIFMLIRAAVSTDLPAQIRDDVIGAMALEIVEGKLRASDIRRRVREYVTQQYRLFSKFGPVSLDARLSEDGNATLLDRLSTEAGTGWDFNMLASTGRRK